MGITTFKLLYAYSGIKKSILLSPSSAKETILPEKNKTVASTDDAIFLNLNIPSSNLYNPRGYNKPP